MSSLVSAETDALEALFSEGSALADCIEGFAPRPGQARMAAAVESAILDADTLVVEAGTGTGKTLAYLVPALLAGRKVILSTGTKTLQDQLFHRDLPALGGALGRPARVVQLKGRSNYLCLHRLKLADGPDSSVAADERAALRLVREWARATRTGDTGEVDGVSDNSSIWPKVTSTQDNCLGTQCELYDRCHVVVARREALAADIVVVNHHLLLADLVLKDEGFGELLPGCEAVIIDEAHQFPEVAQNFFNVGVTSGSLTELANDITAESLTSAIGDKVLADLPAALTKALRSVRLTFKEAQQNIMWDDLPGAFLPALDLVVEVLDDVIDAIGRIDEPSIGLQRCRERAAAAVDRIERVRNADETSGLRWANVTRLGFNINYTPIEIADSLSAMLGSQSCAWIFASATLAVGEDFGHFQRRIGIPDAQTLLIESPFDYASNSRLWLPMAMPQPGERGFTAAMIDRVVPLIHASRGRAFLLFTSHRALQEAARLLRERQDFDYPLLVQGEGSRSRLLEQFVAEDEPVLLGTASFWEGVDIRGQQLSLVAIDKLPFASPGDPLVKARLAAISEQGGDAFNGYQLPQAVLALKQGVGRLIRDYTDRGVVAVFDPRLTSKGYGKRFLASLPPFAITRDQDAVIAFLESV